jgi:transcriptional regulator with AAA-type ATPase domain
VALAGSTRLELEDLPPALIGLFNDVLAPSIEAKDSMRVWASRYVRVMLERCNNNKRLTCRQLGISYHTLQRYLRIRPEHTMTG